MSTVIVTLSGFLGAGKTTLMLSAAELLRKEGLSVACITNDQGDRLVDSRMVEQRDLPLGQIDGGCFCCKFNELLDTIKLIMAAHRPDVIIAEAAGSCTDLTATVIRPLRSLYGDAFAVKPLTTVIDPFRLEEMIPLDENVSSPSFAPEVAYIFRK